MTALEALQRFYAVVRFRGPPERRTSADVQVDIERKERRMLTTTMLGVLAVADAHAPDPPWLWSDKCPDAAQIANQMALCGGCSLHGRRHGWAGPEFDQWALLLPLVS